MTLLGLRVWGEDPSAMNVRLIYFILDYAVDLPFCGKDMTEASKEYPKEEDTSYFPIYIRG